MNSDNILLIVLSFYFLAAGVLICVKGGSFLASLFTIVGMVFAGVAGLILDAMWLHVLILDTLATRGGGISLVVGDILPEAIALLTQPFITQNSNVSSPHPYWQRWSAAA